MIEVKDLPDNGLLKDDNLHKDAKFPIFLLGTGRCGSTLLQKILNSIDHVQIYGEHGGFLKDIARAYFLNLEDKKIGKYIMDENISGKDPDLVYSTLRNPKLWCAWTNWYNKEALRVNFRDFIESFFNPVALRKKVHWGFKEIRYGLADRVIEMLADLYSDARFIFIVRHPVDVVASKISARMSDGIETDAHNWLKQNSFFWRFYGKNSERSIFVRYEDLASEDGLQLKQLFHWLDFPLSNKQSNVIEITKPSEVGRPKRIRLKYDEVDKINTITKELRYELGYSEPSL